MTHPPGEPEPVRPPEPDAPAVPEMEAPAPEPADTPAPVASEPTDAPVASEPDTPDVPVAPEPEDAPATTPPVWPPSPTTAAIPPPPIATESSTPPPPPVATEPPAAPPMPPAPPSPPPPPPASGRARPPVWPYFLTPVAVLLGAAAVVLAIVLTDGGDADPVPPPAPATQAATPAPTVAPAREPDAATPEPAAPTPEAAAPAEEASALLAAFDRYADSLSLDLGQFRECSLHPVPRKAVTDQLRQGLTLGVNGTPTFFVNNKRIVGALPADVFIAIIDAELDGDPPTDIGAYPEEIRQLATVIPPRLVIEDERPDVGGAAIKGDPDAPVVIVEYSDFQCPFCRRWYTDVLPELEGRIGAEVALAFAHFPLSQIHANAEAAHVAAECAGEQGKFWEMHDLLFDRQWEWERLRN